MVPTDARDRSASGPDESNATIFARQTSADLTVFSEQGNAEGWISLASAAVVSIDR